MSTAPQFTLLHNRPLGTQCPHPEGAQHQGPARDGLKPKCCCPLGGGASSPVPPHRPYPGGSRYRLIRQVFPTERSPTTMILEILNLPGRRTRGRSAGWGGPRLPPPAGHRDRRVRGVDGCCLQPPVSCSALQPGSPTPPPAAAQLGPSFPPSAPNSCAVTQGSAHGQRRQPRGVRDPPRAAGGAVGPSSPAPPSSPGVGAPESPQTHPTVPVRCSWQALATPGWKAGRACRAASFRKHWPGGQRGTPG